MKFDVIVGNPPYQGEKNKKNTTNKGAYGGIIWNKFVEESFNLTKEGGFVCLVHPAGWRRPNQRANKVGNLIRSRNVIYLELHSIADGLKTFGVTTNYDWYVAQNSPNLGKTILITMDKLINVVDLQQCPFIPNDRLDVVLSILAKQGEPKCELLADCSTYDHRKLHSEQDEKFNYPCVYSLPQKGIQLRYADIINTKHFGIPKVIFSNGAASQVIVDEKGEYGLTEFAYGIVDSIENLPKIKQAIESEKFVDLCRSFRFTHDKYDYACFRLFRKDFWKEFI